MFFLETGQQARALIAARLGLAFPDARRADLVRGLARALQVSPGVTLEAFLARLATLPDEHPEWGRLAAALTVGETYFFRDPSVFDALERQVLPSLIAARRAEGTLRLRLWSAACATGEEPYSLAILLDRLLPDRAGWCLTILATDINAEALEVARRAQYRDWSLRGAPEALRDRYFHRRRGETLELDPRIRRMVTFAPLNLSGDGYPSVVTNTNAMDLILCRNVLMYFTREAQGAAVRRLQRALLPGGWLLVSPAEASTELLSPLVPVNFPGAILYRNEDPAATRPVAGTRPAAAWTEWPALPSFRPSTPALDQAAARLHEAARLRSQSPPDPEEGAGLSAWPRESQPAMEVPAPSPRQATASAPPDPGGWLNAARALADRGELDEARRLCEAALVENRLDAEAHTLLAAICMELEDLPAAQEALRRSIYLGPDSAAAHFLLGTLLLRQGQRRRGRRSMETVVSLLSRVARDEAVAGSDGLTAGRLLETARAYLASSSESSVASGRPPSAVRHPLRTGAGGR